MEHTEESPPIATDEAQEDEQQSAFPWEQGARTVFAFIDGGGEVQVGTLNFAQPSPAELSAILSVAKAKFDLLELQLLRKEMAQRQQQQQRLYLPQ